MEIVPHSESTDRIVWGRFDGEKVVNAAGGYFG
jgi:hypothetical protein